MYTDNLLGRRVCGMNSSGSRQEGVTHNVMNLWVP